jgi:predicted translation initiation factor SUI1
MAKSNHKSVLFLCTGNYYRSRFAEILFNSVAAKMGLPWRATSKGLALSSNNVGPLAQAAINALKLRGLHTIPEATRFPQAVTSVDFEQAHYIVALKKVEHEPLLQERFPTWTEKVEFWHVDDAPEVLNLIEQEVMDLAARLIVGSKRKDRPNSEIVAEKPSPQPKKETPKNTGAVIKVGRETKGRRGKGVTIVWDVPLDEKGLQELAAKLKQRCGTGGTVKDGKIEIQGDQRDRLVEVLEGMGYKVKRAGG